MCSNCHTLQISHDVCLRGSDKNWMTETEHISCLKYVCSLVAILVHAVLCLLPCDCGINCYFTSLILLLALVLLRDLFLLFWKYYLHFLTFISFTFVRIWKKKHYISGDWNQFSESGNWNVAPQAYEIYQLLVSFNPTVLYPVDINLNIYATKTIITELPY